MIVLLKVLALALFANATVAFLIGFFWQARVISAIYDEANWDGAGVPWKALANKNSPQNKFGHFLAGEFRPDLRRKWWKAISYLIVSFLSLFAYVGLVKFLAPEALG